MENQQGTSVNFEKFTWKIENFSKQNTKKLRSKAFNIRGYKWRILMHPLGKNVNHISLYLMVAGSLPPYGWSRNTYFKLALINQLDPNNSVVKETQQKFNGGYRSWGSIFVNLSDFHDLKQGYLVKNTCIIEAHVCVSDVALKIIPSHDSESCDQEEHDQGTESSYDSETLSSTTFGSSRDPSPKTEEEISDLTLRDLIDLECLGPEESAFVPLLEEACTWHPSLIRSQRKRTRWFKLWAFTSLGQVLYFLKTRKVKDMNEDGCKQLQGLWEELVKSSGFELSWLVPYVESALGLKDHLERTEEVKKLEENVVAMEIKMNKLKEELANAEVEFEMARRGLTEARRGFQEIDLNAELGYSMF